MAISVGQRPLVVARLAVLVFLVVFALYLFFFADWRPRSVDDIKRDLEIFGPAAPYAAAGVQAVAVVFLVPGFLLVIATALLFGKDSIWISFLGQTVGASACFYIARFVGRDFLRKVLGQRLIGIERILEEHGFRYLLYMRLLAFIPLPLVAYGPGLVHIKYRDFLIATLIGEAPFVVVLGFFGDSLGDVKGPRDLFEPQFVFPAILLVALFAVPLTTALLVRRIQVRRAARAASAAASDAARPPL